MKPRLQVTRMNITTRDFPISVHCIVFAQIFHTLLGLSQQANMSQRYAATASFDSSSMILTHLHAADADIIGMSLLDFSYNKLSGSISSDMAGMISYYRIPFSVVNNSAMCGGSVSSLPASSYVGTNLGIAW